MLPPTRAHRARSLARAHGYEVFMAALLRRPIHVRGGVGELGAIFGQAQPPGVGVGGVFEVFVSMEDVNGLTGHMAHLNTDIMNFSVPTDPPCPDGMGMPPCTAEEYLERFYLTRAINQFKWRWTAFYLGWLKWVEDHYGHLSRFGATPVQEFEAFELNYNEFRREFIETWRSKGASTSAPALEPGPSKTSAAGKAVTQVTSTLSLIAIGVIAVAGVMALREMRPVKS